LQLVINKKINNIFFHINHVSVPEPMQKLLENDECKIDAFIGPSHVSVISGSKIYEKFPKEYAKSVVVSGFEPVDVMQSVLMLVRQFVEGRCDLEVEYSRSVTYEGNLVAQKLIQRFFTKRAFSWRGIGNIANSSLRLKDEYAYLDAEKIWAEILPKDEVDDYKLCICGDILRGLAKPLDCKVFGTSCKPSSPLGSCMVSSEGACAAYFKYGNLL
jgi:hydrogenase expression/formation protein HypD